MEPHRKRIQHFHKPGDCHGFTFSTADRRPLLLDDTRRKLLCTAIDRGIEGQDFRLIAFVVMPEHVHLLAYPNEVVRSGECDADRLLFAIKRPCSYRIKRLLQEQRSPLAEELVVAERPGNISFRFWLEGPGYDRNYSTRRSVRNAINYIHNNPVRRGLVSKARDWKWSSARWNESDGSVTDRDLPKIHGPPPEFFDSTK